MMRSRISPAFWPKGMSVFVLAAFRDSLLQGLKPRSIRELPQMQSLSESLRDVGACDIRDKV